MSPQQENLDALARLLTNEETCAAVCYDGNKLLVATNSHNPKTSKYLDLLQAYAKAPFESQYQALLAEVDNQVEKLYRRIKRTSRKNTGVKRRYVKYNKRFRGRAKAIKKNTT